MGGTCALAVGVDIAQSDQEDADPWQICVAVDGAARVTCTLPLRSLPDSLAEAAYQACRLIATRFQVEVSGFWSPDSADGFFAESLDLFEYLPNAEKADPERFHEVCVLEQRDSGLFDEGCESIEDAAALKIPCSCIVM